MKKKVAERLNKRILRDLKGSSSYQIMESRLDGKLSKFHAFADGKPCIGAHLVKNNRGEALWVLVIDWRDNGNYYVSVYPEKSHQGVYAELHNDVKSHVQSELRWKYSPSKQDGKNPARKEAFESLCGSLEVLVSLPGSELTANEFMDDIFGLIEARLAADDLNDDPSSLSGAVHREGRRVWKTHRRIERSSKAARDAKKSYILRNNGRCPCELCTFDFEKEYGSLGQGYIEAHHKVPLHTLGQDEERETLKNDFLMLCANCHRMAHRGNSFESTEELRLALGL